MSALILSFLLTTSSFAQDCPDRSGRWTGVLEHHTELGTESAPVVLRLDQAGCELAGGMALWGAAAYPDGSPRRLAAQGSVAADGAIAVDLVGEVADGVWVHLFLSATEGEAQAAESSGEEADVAIESLQNEVYAEVLDKLEVYNSIRIGDPSGSFWW